MSKDAAKATESQAGSATKAVPTNVSNDVADLASDFVRNMNNTMANAVSEQRKLYVMANAATSETIATIMSLGTGTLAASTQKILKGK